MADIELLREKIDDSGMTIKAISEKVEFYVKPFIIV